MRDPSGHRVSFDPGDPPEGTSWDNDYCADPLCGKPYDPGMIKALERSTIDIDLTTWPYCSVDCKAAAEKREAEADQAFADDLLLDMEGGIEG